MYLASWQWSKIHKNFKSTKIVKGTGRWLTNSNRAEQMADERPKCTIMINHIWFVRLSCCIKIKHKCDFSLYDLWFYIKAISNIYSKNLYPFSTYQTFSSGLIRPFAISFRLCAMEKRHSRHILLSNILLSLHFFQFYLIVLFLLHQI